MTLWVGIDDTDSPRGGCTTFVLTELLALARAHHVDVIGEPRLVRLNPNIPWKTRGNAALSARFGRGEGRPRAMGEVDGRPIRGFPRGRPLSASQTESFREAAWSAVLAASRREERGTDPAMVTTSRALPARVYWKAVREVVPVAEVRRELEARGAWFRSRGSEQGLVGAAAAVAWPGRNATWEMIAYREPARYGLPRRVTAGSVRNAQAAEPELFLCFDPRTRRVLIAPHTPCPILFGLRGTTREAPLRARSKIRSERVERWALFRTNQGTGDHLVPRAVDEWSPLLSGIVRGRVSGEPTLLTGGHVRFPITSPSGETVECLAFEPTKTLPSVARELHPGDELRVWGSRGTAPGVRLEGIEVLKWAPHTTAYRPPRCPTCLRGARSLGRLRGFQCPGCHRRWPPEAARPTLRVPPRPLGRYDPTPSARRHLAPRAPESQ
jgi:tRNA(Ile2)-agmatinylcytidine synthase